MTTLGKTGPDVSRVGLGCMGMSSMHGPADRGAESPEGLEQIERAMPVDAVAGERYPEAQMSHLDSETR